MSWSTRLVPNVWPAGTKTLWTGGHDTTRGGRSPPTARFAAEKTEVERTAEAKEKNRRVHRRLSRPTRPTGRRSRCSSPTTCWPATVPVPSWRYPDRTRRDWEFAEVFDLPIIRTVQPPRRLRRQRHTPANGPAVHSGFLDGLSIVDAKRAIIDWLEGETAHGRRGHPPTGCATGCSAGSGYWGRACSPSSTTRPGLPIAVPDEDGCRSSCPEVDDFLAQDL